MKSGTKMQCAGWLLFFVTFLGIRYCNIMLEDSHLSLKLLLFLANLFSVLLIMTGYQRNRDVESSGILRTIKSFNIRQKLFLIGYIGFFLSALIYESLENSTPLVLLTAVFGFLLEIAAFWSLILFLRKQGQSWTQKKQLQKMHTAVNQKMQPVSQQEEVPTKRAVSTPIPKTPAPQAVQKAPVASQAPSSTQPADKPPVPIVKKQARPSQKKKPSSVTKKASRQAEKKPSAAGIKTSSGSEVTCSRCGRRMKDSKEYDTIHGVIYCMNCLELLTAPEMSTCPGCNTPHLKSDMIYIDGYFYCEKCVEEMTLS